MDVRSELWDLVVFSENVLTIYPVDPPKLINHEILSEQIGAPCSLHLNPDGLCCAVQVEDPYYQGWPPVPHPMPAVDIAAIIAAHG